MKALLSVFLIVGACRMSDFACHAQIPDPHDPANQGTNSVPAMPYPPGSPPVLPYKGNIYEWDTNSITFYNDRVETEPLEIWWTPDLTDEQGWS